MVSEIILALVDVALGLVGDEAEFGMTFEEPWLEVSVADVTEDREGRRMTRCIFRTAEFGDGLEIPIEVLSTYAKGLDQGDIVKVDDRSLVRSGIRSQHPHRLQLDTRVGG